MQVYNSFQEMAAGQTAQRGGMSVFNSEPATHAALKQQVDAILAQAAQERDLDTKGDLLNQASTLIEKMCEQAAQDWSPSIPSEP
jgi:hypothetical protein